MKKLRKTLENCTNDDLANIHDIIEETLVYYLEHLGVDPFTDPRAELLWGYDEWFSEKVDWHAARS